MRTAENFEMWSGEDKVIRVTVKDSAGAALPLTGMSVSWKLARARSAAALVTKTTADGIALVSGGSGGQFDITLMPADTDALAGTFLHEAEITDTAGKKSTVFSGRALILANNA